MIQDILTNSILIVSIFLVLRSFIRFFTVKTNAKSSAHACGTCDSSCPMKGVMQTIEGNSKDIQHSNMTIADASSGSNS